MHEKFEGPLTTPSAVEMEPPDLSSLIDKTLSVLLIQFMVGIDRQQQSGSQCLILY